MLRERGRLALCLCLALLSSLAHAAELDDAQLIKMEELRGEIAGQIHLKAFDLLDEMALQILKAPMFSEPTAVVLADVSVPVSLGTPLKALIENHLSELFLKNPASQIQLIHCPSCTAMMVHSGRGGTVISRGVDNPDALGRFSQGKTRHALFIDFEAEGSSLVLRARLSRLDESLPIVWSYTLSSSGGTASMLREPGRLKTASEARKEYVEALKGRGPVSFPVRIAVRAFDAADDLGIAPAPLYTLQAGVELSLNQSRAWTGSFVIGYGYIPQAYNTFVAQLRFHRLLTGTSRSFVRPDLYAFLGSAMTMVWGPSAALFSNDELTSQDLIGLATGADPFRFFATVNTGLELRLGNRLGLAMFVEWIPQLNASPNLGKFLDIFFFHTLGAEVSFWF